MPNVVIIHTDDTGQYCGPYGHDVQTPALERLADESICFRRAYCAGPNCSPSRGAMMTGQCPHSNGLVGLAHHGFRIDDYDHHLASFLSDDGFESVLAGQQHEALMKGHDDQRREDRHEAARTLIGYDRTLEGDTGAVRSLEIDHGRTRWDLANAEAAADYIRTATGDPFFLSFGLWNAHDDADGQGDVDPGRVQPPATLPDLHEVRESVAGYHQLLEYVDECVGTVMEALRESGQLEETVVIFTTDHGPVFPFMKGTLFDGGLGISLIARFPEPDCRGETHDALVSNVDVFPTLCEYLDVGIPDWVQGTSLLPLVRGETEQVREEIYAELNWHAVYEPKRAVRTDRYKYIRRFGETAEEWVPANFPASPGDTSAPYVADRIDRGRPKEALYDCYTDPHERENLVNDPDHEEVYEDLSGRLDSWMRATDDPLLHGDVPPPETILEAFYRHNPRPDN